MMELLLIRHCEATGQEPEAPLTERGFGQADALVERLAHAAIDHVVASPFLRARQTIDALCAARGLPLHTDERLIEHTLASPPIPEWRAWVARAFQEPERSAPGGDAPAQTLARAQAALREVRSNDGGLGVIVTHGLLLSLVLHSIDASFGFEGWASLENPDVFRVSGGPDEMHFERL